VGGTADATARVDIGGYEVRFLRTGTGSPAVILDSGMGNALDVWSKVQPEVARFAEVLSYDRLGLGYSDPGPKPRTARQIAEELHLLLWKLGITPPYVLVGHSIGAFHIRVFASLYPDEVAGLVFVQGSHEDLQDRRRELIGEEAWKAYTDALNAFFAAQPEGVRSEWDAYEQSRKQVRETGKLPDVPVAIVTGMKVTDLSKSQGYDEQVAALSYEFQHKWAEGRPEGTHIVSKASGTNVPVEDPGMVVDAIRRVVLAAAERADAAAAGGAAGEGE